MDFKRRIVDIIKQTKNHTCLHCVLAFITNETELYVENWFKNYGENVMLNIKDACLYLVHHGILICTTIRNIDKSIIGHEYVSIIAFDGTPLLIATDSEDFPGCGHVIYWDGKKVYDPNPNTLRTRLSEYTIENAYPITDISDREF